MWSNSSARVTHAALDTYFPEWSNTGISSLFTYPSGTSWPDYRDTSRALDVWFDWDEVAALPEYATAQQACVDAGFHSDPDYAVYWAGYRQCVFHYFEGVDVAAFKATRAHPIVGLPVPPPPPPQPQVWYAPLCSPLALSRGTMGLTKGGLWCLCALAYVCVDVQAPAATCSNAYPHTLLEQSDKSGMDWDTSVWFSVALAGACCAAGCACARCFVRARGRDAHCHSTGSDSSPFGCVVRLHYPVAVVAILVVKLVQNKAEIKLVLCPSHRKVSHRLQSKTRARARAHLPLPMCTDWAPTHRQQ